VKYNLKK